MTSIRVRAVAGRIAREAPDGPFIPEDHYVSVERTPYVDRLLNVWGDIEEEPAPKPKPVEAPKVPAAPADSKEDS